MTQADAIQERLIQFAAGIITLCDTLPLTTANEHIAARLMRSATSPALNHIAARSAATHVEIISNIKIAVAALDESEFWLSIIIAGDRLSPNMLAPLLADCQQLQYVLIAAIKYVNKPENHPPAVINHPNGGNAS